MRARIGQLHPGQAVVLMVALVRPVSAQELAVTVRCELTPEQQQELDARVRLLVHGADPPAPGSIDIVCEGDAGSVTLRYTDHVRSQSLPTASEPVEQMLLAVEQLLATRPAPAPSSGTSTKATPSNPESSPNQSPEEMDLTSLPKGSDEDRLTPREQSRVIGGASLGVSVESWPDPAGLALGPRLDFAWGMGSWAATSFESLRFGSTPEARLLAFDALVGVAWGAPFAHRRPGAVVAFGGEWFSRTGSAEPTGQRTSSSFVVAFGLRWAETLGPAALWLGADGRFRVRPPELPEPAEASLSRWSVIVSLGGALTVR